MKERKHIMFVNQQMDPYLLDSTPTRAINRMLPEKCQANGFETRTFMPKFGEINERRNQLHDVIRLSGINIPIEMTDHPLIIKVASIQSARIQIYFIDNDELFRNRRGIRDEFGIEYADNDERCIFYARGVLETVMKLRWAPDVIQISGWMSALVPLYVKRTYAQTPFFMDTKIVIALDDNEFVRPFTPQFSEKLISDGILTTDLQGIAGLPVTYEDLMHLAIDYADAVLVTTPNVNQRLITYATNRGKDVREMPQDDTKPYLDFYNE